MDNSDIPNTMPSFGEIVRINYSHEKARVAKKHPLPKRFVEMLDRYVLYHQPPGDFLAACLSNDFKTAVTSADAEALHYIYNIAIWIINVLPSGAQGSPERYERWLQDGE